MEHETTLGAKLASMIVAPDLWATAAVSYLDALPQTKLKRTDATSADDLHEWNTILIERLAGSEAEPLLDQLVAHPAFAGEESTALKHILAQRRGDADVR